MVNLYVLYQLTYDTDKELRSSAQWTPNSSYTEVGTKSPRRQYAKTPSDNARLKGCLDDTYRYYRVVYLKYLDF